MSREGPNLQNRARNLAHAWRADAPDVNLEIRPAVTVSHVAATSRLDEKARRWAAEIGDLMQQHGGGSRRLAIERVYTGAATALAAQGFEIKDAQEPVERARAVKTPEEITCIKRSLAAVEAGVARMRQALRPGMTENQSSWA